MNPATSSGPNSERSMTPAMRASRLLGWASFAIGAAELLAPKRVARAVGLPEESALLVRACGARQMMTGVGAHSVYPVPALWGRFAGDLIDLGLLGVAARRPEGGRNKGAWIAMGAMLGVAALDAAIAGRLAAETKEGNTADPPKDYTNRSGFPGGDEVARGPGIVQEALAGKAGGAAAGDTSPAGEAATGRSTTDLAGAPVSSQSAGNSTGDLSAAPGPDSQGSEQKASEVELPSGGQTMPKEAAKVVPEPPAYTPA